MWKILQSNVTAAQSILSIIYNLTAPIPEVTYKSGDIVEVYWIGDPTFRSLLRVITYREDRYDYICEEISPTHYNSRSIYELYELTDSTHVYSIKSEEDWMIARMKGKYDPQSNK